MGGTICCASLPSADGHNTIRQPPVSHLIITQYTLWCTTHSNRPLEGKAGAMLTNILCH